MVIDNRRLGVIFSGLTNEEPGGLRRLQLGWLQFWMPWIGLHLLLTGLSLTAIGATSQSQHPFKCNTAFSLGAVQFWIVGGLIVEFWAVVLRVRIGLKGSFWCWFPFQLFSSAPLTFCTLRLHGIVCLFQKQHPSLVYRLLLDTVHWLNDSSVIFCMVLFSVLFPLHFSPFKTVEPETPANGLSDIKKSFEKN